MINKRFPISQEGYDRLLSELNNLKNSERPKIISSIIEARAHGDLSENAEYHAAREKQAFIEAKISELEDKISRAEIIDISKSKSDKIQYGSSIKLIDEESGQEVVYKIVSDYEADVSRKFISISSPLAKALIGKKTGESFELKTPKGVRYYQISSVSFI